MSKVDVAALIALCAALASAVGDVIRQRSAQEITDKPVGHLELFRMSLRDRWASWDRSPFTGDSTSHVSVWEKTGSPPRSAGSGIPAPAGGTTRTRLPRRGNRNLGSQMASPADPPETFG